MHDLAQRHHIHSNQSNMSCSADYLFCLPLNFLNRLESCFSWKIFSHHDLSVKTWIGLPAFRFGKQPFNCRQFRPIFILIFFCCNQYHSWQQQCARLIFNKPTQWKLLLYLRSGRAGKSRVVMGIMYFYQQSWFKISYEEICFQIFLFFHPFQEHYLKHQ